LVREVAAGVLSTLPPDAARMFRAYHIEGQTMSEIAVSHCVSRVTVYNRLEQVRTALQTALAEIVTDLPVSEADRGEIGRAIMEALVSESGA
jgi:DNA-directed RNA polymerase specialized sigma24 family protein